MQTFPQSGYTAERVLSASPLELIRMLYEGALSSVHLAIEMLHSGDVMARGRAITKAVDIIQELRASLREEVNAEYSATLMQLYGYMQMRLVEAHASKSEDALLEVSRLLKCLYEAWLGVMRNLAGAGSEDGPADAPSSPMPVNPYEACLVSPSLGRSWKV